MKKIFIISLIMFLSISLQSAIVTLSWEVSNKKDIIGYRLTYGSTAGVSKVVDVGNVTKYDVDVMDDREYYFTVISYDKDGNQGKPSNTVKWKPKSPPKEEILSAPKLKIVRTK